MCCEYRQDITAAAMRACRDAISSNSIPAFRRGNMKKVFFFFFLHVLMLMKLLRICVYVNCFVHVIVLCFSL